MEIKVLKRYNHKVDIQIGNKIYYGVYPVGVNIDNAEEMKDNKIEVTINYEKENIDEISKNR